MKSFTINDLVRFSGIKAHTFRIWEKRYATQSGRTATNRREYTLQEVKELLGISLLTRHGYKISKATALSPLEIEQSVEAIQSNEGRQQASVNSLLLHMYAMDAKAFDETLEKAFSVWSQSEVLEHIIYPLLHKTHIIWRGHQLNEEHFVVTCIRRKIIVAIEGLPKIDNPPVTVLLFLHDTSQLDLALLYANYLLKQRGVHVLYMGNDITITNLKAYIESEKPDYLYSYIPQKNNFPFAGISNYMKDVLPDSMLVVTTYPELNRSEWDNVIVMEYLEAINWWID